MPVPATAADPELVPPAAVARRIFFSPVITPIKLLPVRTFFGSPRALIGLVDAVTGTDVNGVALLLLEVEVEVEILELDDGFLNPNFQAFTFSSPP